MISEWRLCVYGVYVFHAGGGEACVQGESDGVGLTGEIYVHF